MARSKICLHVYLVLASCYESNAMTPLGTLLLFLFTLIAFFIFLLYAVPISHYLFIVYCGCLGQEYPELPLALSHP